QSGRLRHPECDEPGRPFVDHGAHGKPPVARQRECERGVSRPGRGDRVAHAAADERVDERLNRGVGRVGWDHSIVRASVTFVRGFMQRGEAWQPAASRLAERYTSACLDFSTWTFDERVAEILAAAAPGAAL